MLQELATPYVDSMLLHSPPRVTPRGSSCDASVCALARSQWSVLEDEYAKGRARAIGVSNYCSSCLQCLLGNETRVTPMLNQITYHAGMPGADPTGLLGMCRAANVVPQAYSPLGNYKTHSLIHANITNTIGSRKTPKRSGAAVALRWVAQHSVPMCVAADVMSYLREDADTWSWSLDADDMTELDGWDGAREDPTRGACE